MNFTFKNVKDTRSHFLRRVLKTSKVGKEKMVSMGIVILYETVKHKICLMWLLLF